MSQNFIEKLTHAIDQNDSLLCVGLDPDPFKYPQHFPGDPAPDALVTWAKSIINQTADLVCCYKPNIAFYEQFGPPGLEALRQIIAAVPTHIPILLDAKRGDIGSTATAYARAVFDGLGVDAVTVNPYLGRDSIDPFIAHPGKAVFVLCYTSNPSAQEIQTFSDGQTPLFEHIVNQSVTWGDETQICFVVGATQPHVLTRFRQLNDTHWILAPGIGAQGGDLAATLTAGLNSRGSGLIVPVSRGVICAADPRAAAQSLREAINQVRTEAIAQPAALRGDLIRQLYTTGCVQFGEFTLSSGQKSPIYIDLRRMGSNPKLLKAAARVYADLVRRLTFDHIAGVPYAALPIGTAVALKLERSLIYPRKEAKAYGTGKSVEGVFEPGERAVVIEDVVTSGGSMLNAIETLEQAGLVISDAVVLIDRGQGGPQNLADKGYHLHAVLTMPEILHTLHQAGFLSGEQLNTVTNYLAGKSN